MASPALGTQGRQWWRQWKPGSCHRLLGEVGHPFPPDKPGSLLRGLLVSMLAIYLVQMQRPLCQAAQPNAEDSIWQ